MEDMSAWELFLDIVADFLKGLVIACLKLAARSVIIWLIWNHWLMPSIPITFVQTICAYIILYCFISPIRVPTTVYNLKSKEDNDGEE